MHELTGQCHCGALSYRLSVPVPVPVATLPARACQCGFCTRIDAAWTSHPDGELDLFVRGSASPVRYRFGTGTADFLICGLCGILVAAVSRIDGRDYAVINLRSAKGGLAGRERVSADFDGEQTCGRLERRCRNWIPTVRFNKGYVV